MKTLAAVLTQPGRILLKEMEREPTPQEVLVKVAVCGLCSWELKHFTGQKGPGPMTLGHEWAGTVMAAGSQVKSLSPGDKVAFYPGAGSRMEGFAQYLCAREDHCFKLSSQSDVSLAILEPLKCIVTVLRAAAPEAGDAGVVVGCGAMGLWSMQGLPTEHMAMAIAVDVDDEKLKLARRFGATHTINPRREDVAERIREITGGRMADFVIEGTGVPSVLADTLDYVCRQGRVVIMSSYPGISESVDFRKLCMRGARIVTGMPNSSQDPAEDMRRAVKMFERGIFQAAPLVTHRFRLEEIQNAFDTLSRKPEGYIKGIVLMDER